MCPCTLTSDRVDMLFATLPITATTLLLSLTTLQATHGQQHCQLQVGHTNSILKSAYMGSTCNGGAGIWQIYTMF